MRKWSRSSVRAVPVKRNIAIVPSLLVKARALNNVGPAIVTLLLVLLVGCDSSRDATSTEQTAESESMQPTSSEQTPIDEEMTVETGGYCNQFQGQTGVYFCEDFDGVSPLELAGLIPPMSFRDQTYREYTRNEIFSAIDPTEHNQHDGVIDLHADLVDGKDFSEFARRNQQVATKWDITAHSRDGFVQPGTGSGFNDEYWWNESFLMGEHGHRCGSPPDIEHYENGGPGGGRAYAFMERTFELPEEYNGDQNQLSLYWLPELEKFPDDSSGLHPIIRYEDMIYTCSDHLMTAAYARGASKLTLTPNAVLDTSGGSGTVEFSVSTYRTAGRDYWQLDLTPLQTHLQLPEGDVVADANGKAINGLAINTQLDEGATGLVDLLGGINVFRTVMLKDGQFIEQGRYYEPDDPEAEFVRAQIANPGNPERLDLYSQAPPGAEWVITHSSYNQVMYDYLDGDNDSSVTLHNVTSNRQRSRFRLTVLKSPIEAEWSDQPELWDQVSLCMPDYGNRCVGEYIVPELPAELLVQFTHYAYNTTKSCTVNIDQPHDNPGAQFQSICHPNTYHWDDFYLSPVKPFTIIKSIDRTRRHDGMKSEPLKMTFISPALEKSKLRFNALTAGVEQDGSVVTSLEVSFDQGLTWHRPRMQPEPENNFDRFRSYYTGASEPYIPVGVQEVWFRAQNPVAREAFWIRDASFWSAPQE